MQNNPLRDESHHNTGCVTLVALLISEALEAIAWQREFRSDVRLHRVSQAAKFGHRSQLRHDWSWGYPQIHCDDRGVSWRLPGHAEWSRAAVIPRRTS